MLLLLALLAIVCLGLAQLPLGRASFLLTIAALILSGFALLALLLIVGVDMHRLA